VSCGDAAAQLRLTRLAAEALLGVGELHDVVHPRSSGSAAIAAVAPEVRGAALDGAAVGRLATDTRVLRDGVEAERTEAGRRGGAHALQTGEVPGDTAVHARARVRVRAHDATSAASRARRSLCQRLHPYTSKQTMGMSAMRAITTPTSRRQHLQRVHWT